MATPITLRVFRDGAVVSTHRVEEDLVKIGKLASSHLRLEDPKISRIHAVLEVGADGALSIIDMGSAQGTLVNGKRITKVALASGDEIVVGDHTIEVVVGAADEEEATETVAPTTDAGAARPAATPAQEAAPEPDAAPEAVAVAEPPSDEEPSDEEPAPAVEAAPAADPEAEAEAESEADDTDTTEAPAQAPAPATTMAAAAGDASAAARTTVAGGSWQPPSPWPKEGRGAELALSVQLFWGDQPLDAGSFVEDGPVTLGGPQATFAVDPGDLPQDPFPIATREGGSWTVSFPRGASGGVVRDGEVVRLEELSSQGQLQSNAAGGWDLSLDEHAAAWIEMGQVRAEFFFRPKRKPVVVKWSETLDYGYLNLLLIAFFLTAGAVVAFQNMEVRTTMTADDLFANQARFTKLLLQPPEKTERNPFLQRLKELKAPERGETVRAPGEEGKAGRPDAPKVERRSAPQAIDPNDPEAIKNQGILSVLGKGSAGLSTVLGSGGLGGELKGAIGGITGNTVGDAQGVGGLGLRGVGPGGGAVGETVTVGAIGTRGRGGGTASFGAGVGGLGKKGSAEVKIDTSAVSITGTIDRELIRRVIQANHGKFKYCYESELVRNPNLSGRVAIQFQIDTTGRVTLARVSQSTMGNATVENCVATRIRQLTFPMPQGGGSALVTYPFVFNPPGE